MQPVKKTPQRIPWTWADQISTYRFWGIFLFCLFMLIPNIILNYTYSFLGDIHGIDVEGIGTLFSVKSLAGFGGFWLAWFMVRLRNHYLLYLYSGLTLIGLLLMLFIPSIITMVIGFFLIGLCFGAISLAVPTIIAGGRGGSEMFVISFGLITLFQLSAWSSFPFAYTLLQENSDGSMAYLLTAILATILAILLLIPVDARLFNSNPPKRIFSLKPTFRNPWHVALLCLVPVYNIYYIFHLYYRLHGEVNTLSPSRQILSPRAATWCAILLSFLAPVMTSSLNSRLALKFRQQRLRSYYRNWTVILWAFLFVPISFALLQSNMNQLIQLKHNIASE